ncbi:phosphate-starvation-inducible PsiE family protein [uncultured Methylobacterium sp.]|uniref:phosphate-starvation-inducible PsiE family protein n=1 Tax=uncultured Methylobacterium sp. TaxID=157278 RepID=UPI0035CBDF5E
MDQRDNDDSRPRATAGDRPPELLRAVTAPTDTLKEVRAVWSTLTLYERFEEVVVLALTGLISLVVVAAMVNLSYRIVMLLLVGLLDPAEHSVFQAVFGMIFTVLIALEFNHSILGVLKRGDTIIQVRTVVLIALLALTRKFIILDATKVEPMTIIGLAAAVLALGTVHWLVRDQDRKDNAANARTEGRPA